MCVATMALSLLVATCEPIAIDTSPLETLVVQKFAEPKRLSDPKLDRIRGGNGYIAKIGRNGIVQLVRDGNLRDMTLASPQITQLTDNWSAEIGASYVALSLSRP